MLLNLHLLGLGDQMVKNFHRLACKFDHNQSEHKPSQVNTSTCKAWPNGVASRPKFSTCMYLWVCLARDTSEQIYGVFQILVILSTL